MTSNKEKLAKINLKIKKLVEKQSDLRSQEINLDEQQQVLIRNIIAEENTFNNTKWELFFGHSTSNIYLNYLSGNRKAIESLRNLCFTSWHDSFELNDGIVFRFDDGSYSLTAKEPRDLISFAEKNKFTISADDIGEQINKLSKQLAALQEIIFQFKVKA